MSVITDYLDLRKIKYRYSSNGFAVLGQCVFCDGKLKMGINLKNPKFAPFFYRCFKCEMKGHFLQVVQEIDQCSYHKALDILGIEIKETDESTILNVEQARRIKETFSRIKEENVAADIPILAKSFAEYDYQYLLTTNLSEEAKAYLYKRGMNDADIQKSGVLVRGENRNELIVKIANKYDLDLKEIEKLLDLVKKSSSNPEVEVLPRLVESAPQKYVAGFCALRELNRLNGRVIFPVTFNEQFTGYVARDFRPKPYVKVLNSFDLDVFACFWNFNNVKKSKFIVITEGIFSAISCGIDRTIAFLGKSVSENISRYDLLRETEAETICVYLDVGAANEAKYLCSKLQTYYSDVRIVICPTVLKIASPITRPHDLRIAGISIEEISDKEIYISYENYFVCKKAIKIALTEYQERHKIFTIIKRQITERNLLQKIITTSRLCTQNPELQRLVEIIAKGDFLDANDFGKEVNDKLIKKACVYDGLAPSSQLLDKIIVKMPK